MAFSLSLGLGDLSDDLLGSANPNLKIGNIGSDSLSEELSMMFSEPGSTNLNLILNDSQLSDIKNVNADIEAKNKKLKSDALRAAKLKASLGKDAHEIYQCLHQTLSDDEIASLPGIANLLNYPFIWSVIVSDPSAFDSCEQTKQSFQEIRKRSIFVLSTPQCAGCQNRNNDHCHKFGKKLIENLDFTPKTYSEISAALKQQGIIASNKSVTSMEDIKHAFSPKPESSSRTYVAPKRQSTPAISQKDAVDFLKMQSAKKRDEEKQQCGEFLTAEAGPMAQKILALVYRGACEEEINQIEATTYSPESRELFTKLNAAFNDPLVKSRMLFTPEIFSNCEQAKTFLAKNGVKTEYIRPCSQCDDCNDNIRGNCSRLGGTLLSQEIPEYKRIAAIDELLITHQITAEQAQEYKEIEKTKYLAGLRRAHSRAGQKLRTAASKCEPKVNSFVESTSRYANCGNALSSAIDQLSSGVPLSSVRNVLRSKQSKTAADNTLEEALFSLSTISADILDDCTQNRHQFQAGAVLVRTEKCAACQYAVGVECSKTRLTFNNAVPTFFNADQIPEAQEILDIFYNPEGRIDIKGDDRISSLDIDLSTDSGTVYDIGQVTKCDLPNLTAGEMVVDIDLPSKGENPLDIQGLGGGLDIGSCI